MNERETRITEDTYFTGVLYDIVFDFLLRFVTVVLALLSFQYIHLVDYQRDSFAIRFD